MNIRRITRRTAGTLAAAATLAAIPLHTPSAQAATPVAGCQIYTAGTLVYIANNTLNQCANIVRASAYGSQPGYGRWANTLIAVDAASNVYAQNGARWQRLGTAVNSNGTVGSLSDRCFAGDVQACRTWTANTQAAIDAYNRRYGR